MALGVSGKNAWGNYAFQLAYGNSSGQNLVKLNNDLGYDGTSVMQEQWYNNAKLEDIFSQAVAVLSAGGCTTDWRVQNQTTWKSFVLEEACHNLLNKENGGMYVRWIRSGDILTLWVSSDGVGWIQTQSYTGFTNNDLYILANQNLGARLPEEGRYDVRTR